MVIERQFLKKSRELCIEENDYKTLYQKWQNANNRWKEFWYDGFVALYQEPNNKKVRKEYDIIISEKWIAPHKVIVKQGDVNFTETASEDYQKGKELLYWIDLDTADGNHIYYKVGTTTRPPRERMNEHLSAYENDGVSKVVVHRVIDCGEIPAEGLESYIRAKLILKYPKAFKTKDRFVASEDVVITAEEIDKWVAEYLG